MAIPGSQLDALLSLAIHYEEGDLYGLIPYVVRAQSLLASQLTEETDTDESILRKVIYTLEEEYATISIDIKEFRRLIDTNTCAEAYLPYLANLIFGDSFGDWSEDKKRMVVKGVVLLWLLKGTHLSWKAFLRLHTLREWTIYELWKSTIYETYYYSRSQEYNLLKSARVDLEWSCIDWSTLTLVEWMAFSLDGWDYFALDATSAIATNDDDMLESERQTLIGYVEEVRPIHVLLRPRRTLICYIGWNDFLLEEWDILTLEGWSVFALIGDCIDSPFTPLPESLGTASDSIDIDVQPSGGFGDPASDLSDSVIVAVTCVSWCEGACEGAGCEAGCEAYCEGSCASICQGACETTCMSTCENACEYGVCEMMCQMTCQLVVQPQRQYNGFFLLGIATVSCQI